jgi:hypothetical protein
MARGATGFGAPSEKSLPTGSRGTEQRQAHPRERGALSLQGAYDLSVLSYGLVSAQTEKVG